MKKVTNFLKNYKLTKIKIKSNKFSNTNINQYNEKKIEIKEEKTQIQNENLEKILNEENFQKKIDNSITLSFSILLMNKNEKLFNDVSKIIIDNANNEKTLDTELFNYLLKNKELFQNDISMNNQFKKVKNSYLFSKFENYFFKFLKISFFLLVLIKLIGFCVFIISEYKLFD
jgi:hypothetical protein